MSSDRSSAQRLAHAHAHLIVRRVWVFALGWVAMLLVWVAVFVASGRLTLLGAAGVLAGNAALLAGWSACVRRGSALARVRAVTCAVCVALGLAVGALGMVMHVSGDVLAFMLLTLYLTSALLFAWGWRAEGALLVGTMLPLGLVSPRLEFLVAPAELITALAVGSLLCLAVAEGGARSFRIAFLRRQSAEEAAAEVVASRDAYRDLAESARDYIYAGDLAGRITYLNEAAARSLGRPADELLGTSVLEWVTDHPENPSFAAVIEGLLQDDAPPPLRVQGVTAAGPRWFEVMLSLIRDVTGRPTGIRGISRDIDDRLRAERRLRESEERYRSLVETQLEAIVRFDRGGRLTFANEYWLRTIGRSPAETLGRGQLDLVHPDDAAEITAGWETLRLGERSATRRYRVRTVDGYRWFEWEGRAVVDERGDAVEYQAVGRDVHERHVAEEALRESESRYRLLVESQHDLVFRGDTEGRTLFINDALARMFGIRREDVIGRSFVPFVHPDELEHTFEAVRALQRPPHRLMFENRAYAAARQVRWIEWEAAGIADASGRIVEVQGVGRDVTERKQAEAALQRSLEELTRSQEQLRSLAQRQVAIREQERKRLGLDLHDDVCQELVGIGILLESIRRRLGPISTENAHEFDRIGGYLGQLVDHLRLLARELQPLQLHDLGLTGGLRSLVQGFSSASCSVDSLFPTAIPRLAEETEVGVYRIAQEALTNAIRHAEADDVRLMLAVIGGRLRLEVSDDGRGFDTSARKNALGLVSMEERALSLGGRLTIWSTLGGGTTVRLECPLGGRASASAA